MYIHVYIDSKLIITLINIDSKSLEDHEWPRGHFDAFRSETKKSSMAAFSVLSAFTGDPMEDPSLYHNTVRSLQYLAQ